MTDSNINFSVKFFRPSQRTVFLRNGLLDIRTKNTIAQDRFIVAEQRVVNVEKKKSISYLQLLTFERRQLEKRLSSRTNPNRSLLLHRRSISETSLENIGQSLIWNDPLEISQSELCGNLNHSQPNSLFLSNDGRLSRAYSAFLEENPMVTSDSENSADDDNNERNNSNAEKKTISQPPIIVIIPPEEEILLVVE